jgi:hypothetical protein
MLQTATAAKRQRPQSDTDGRGWRRRGIRRSAVGGRPVTAAQRSVSFSFLENLQQHVPHVRMRLFDFVEQHHGIGIAPHFSVSWPPSS